MNSQILNEMKKCYESFEIEDNPLLRKWKKAQLISAVGAFKMQWFQLCKTSLELTYIPIEDISQEPKYLELLNRHVSSVDDTTLKTAIEKLHK